MPLNTDKKKKSDDSITTPNPQTSLPIFMTKICLCVMLLLFIALIVYAVIGSYQQKGSAVLNENTVIPVSLDGDSLIYDVDSLSWKQLDNLSPKQLESAKSICFRGHFSDEIEKNKIINAYVDNLNVEIIVNGESLFIFGDAKNITSDNSSSQIADSLKKHQKSAEDASYFKIAADSIIYRLSNTASYALSSSKLIYEKAPGYTIAFIESPGITPEDDVQISIYNPYYDIFPDSISKFMDSFTITHGYELYAEKNSSYNFGSIIALFVIFSCLIGLIIAFSLFKKSDVLIRQNVFIFVLYAFSGGLFTLFSSLQPYMPLFISNPALCNILCTAPLIMFIAVSSVSITSSLQISSLRLVTQMFSIITVMLAIMLFMFQLFSFLDLYRSQYIEVIAGVIIGLVGLICLFLEYKETKDTHALAMLISFVPLIIALPFENINSYIKILPDALLLSIAILISVMIQMINLINFSRKKSFDEIQALRDENNLFQSRNAIMLSQIQPHFLYEALNSIQMLCDSNPQQASYSIETFSKYLRTNIDSLSRKEPIAFSREITHVKNYLTLELLRHPNLNVEYDLASKGFRIPALTIQPLVENSVRYGIISNDANGTIKISSFEDKDNYYVTISDNGNGFNPTEIQYDGRSHIGLSNTRNRLASMSGGSLDIESTPGKGTKITITLPKHFHNIKEKK